MPRIACKWRRCQDRLGPGLPGPFFLGMWARTMRSESSNETGRARYDRPPFGRSRRRTKSQVFSVAVHELAYPVVEEALQQKPCDLVVRPRLLQGCTQSAGHVTKELDNGLGRCDDGVTPRKPANLLEGRDKISHGRHGKRLAFLVADFGLARPRSI